MASARRIDTHQHIVPPGYAAWLSRRGITSGGKAIPPWTPDAALALMDANGIEKGILSISTPGVHLGDDHEARGKAREANEYSAEVAAARPERFGFFATVPLPDVEGAIAEAAYALDRLSANGVALLANVHGIYLGDPAFEPLMAELDRRETVIFVHPSSLPAPEVPGIPHFVADFLLDTVRAAINLARSGTLERHPNLKIILSHGGGFIPYAAARIAVACSPDGNPDGGIARLRRFYYDTALTSSPWSLPSLLSFADPDRVVFGSDWPFAAAERASGFTSALDHYTLEPAQRFAIDRGNAERILGE